MHGLIASALCSANKTDIPKLFFGKNALVPMKQKLLNPSDSNEFFKLFQKFYDVIRDGFNNSKPFTPFVNLTKLRRDSFVKNELLETEQRNLLSWYLGYFYGYGTIWMHSKITDLLITNPKDQNGGSLSALFSVALSTQANLAYALLVKFSPELKDERFTSIAALINTLHTSFNQSDVINELKDANDEHLFCKYLSSIFNLTNMVTHPLKFNKDNATVH